jgi:hypothetical protein
VHEAGVPAIQSQVHFWVQKNVGDFVRLEKSDSRIDLGSSIQMYGKNFDNGIIRGVWSGLLPEQEGTFIGQNQDASFPG